MKEFYRDSYKFYDVSTVKTIVTNGDKLGVVLENTIFFPGGGGQAKDEGYIVIDGNKFPVIGFVEENGEIIHIIDKKHIEEYKVDSNTELKVGKSVELLIDRDVRLDGMCQHSAQHLLSGVIFKKYGKNTTGLHIGREITQLDIEGSFDDEMVEWIEKEANRCIYENISVKNYVLDDKDKASFYTRRAIPKTDDEIRIMEIDGIDVNACCGVHVQNLRDISAIKIKRYYKHKDGTRFEYLAGKRVVDYLLENDRCFSRIMKKFNSNTDTIEKAIENLEKKKDEFYSDREFLIEKYKEICLDKIYSRDEESFKYINLDEFSISLARGLVSSITDEREIVLFCRFKNDNKYHFIAQSSLKDEIDLGREYREFVSELKKLTVALSLKGGGGKNNLQAQSENEEDIDKLVEYFIEKYI